MQIGTSAKMRTSTLGALLVAIPASSACFGGSTTEPTRDVVNIQMLPASATVRVGATVNMVASAVDAIGGPVFGKTYVWASQDTALLESRPGGVFFGKKAGLTTVTATVDGIKGTATVTIAP